MTKRRKLFVPTVVTVATVGVAAGAAYVARYRKDDVKELFVAQALERPAARQSYAELAQGLERAGVALFQRAGRAADTQANRAVLTHIIGLERWGQERLRAALGEREFVRDEHHPYKPGAGVSLRELQELLSQTRSRTVDLARRLNASPPAEGLTVEHNGLGPLTPKGWLRYLTQHADLESRKLRGEKEAKALGE
ncbi:DNA-binding protein [Deinococcus sp. RL]|uniref:DinB family protein n=1 Tax=Deinococcus sp. RL TaxID=1489678 RepID=UPI0004DAFB37|nr:DinB family protein [Deinococcus sp. RL]KEF34185.1 DNA-binding protein [Deinococcus sp. RL]